jgi:hypothetical protein
MLLPVLLCLSPALGQSPPPDPQAHLASLVAAELAFAHRAQEIGYRKAFWETFAEDSVVFLPRPTPAKAHYAKAADDPAKLRWFASWAKVSADGRFGLTSGPWQYQPAGEGKPTFGHFVTVWRRTPQRWEVVLDAGVPHPAQEEWELPFLPRNTPPRGAFPAPARPVAALDGAFTREAAGKGVAETYAAYAGELRFLRPKQLPGRPLASRGEDFAQQKGHAWVAESSGAAANGDLAYSYGYRQDPAGHQKAVYVRFWRAEAGSWKLDLDLELPVEEKAK